MKNLENEVDIVMKLVVVSFILKLRDTYKLYS